MKMLARRPSIKGSNQQPVKAYQFIDYFMGHHIDRFGLDTSEIARGMHTTTTFQRKRIIGLWPHKDANVHSYSTNKASATLICAV